MLLHSTRLLHCFHKVSSKYFKSTFTPVVVEYEWNSYYEGKKKYQVIYTNILNIQMINIVGID